jgi:transmembrane sensor
MENELYIRELIIKEHFGLISEEEQLELDGILATSEEARKIREEVQEVPADDAREYLENVNLQAGLDNVYERYNTQRARRRNRNRLVSAAALIAAVAVGAYFWMPGKKATLQQPQQTAQAAEGSATLQLANGQVITMSDSGQQHINLQNTNVQNNNRVLKFDVQDNEAATGWNTLTVPPTLDYQVVLSDGTQVWLNSTSKIRFPFKFPGNQREVFIEGEAYFTVKQDATRPFIVHAGQADIQVLGTSFNVNAYRATQVITSLVQGKVAVQSGTGKLLLDPGKEVVVATGEPLVMRDFDQQTTLAWRQGEHYFRDASIREIGEMMSRWYDVDLVIDNPEAGNMRLRGKLYRHRPLQSFLDQLNSLGLVQFYWKNNVLHCK